jgi:hypothetical protein
MKRLWDADIVVPPQLASTLIETQFPSLAPAAIESLGHGLAESKLALTFLASG